MGTRTRREGEGEWTDTFGLELDLTAEFIMMMTSTAPALHNDGMSTVSLKRFAWLSIAAAISTILLKTAGWQLTGSVGLLSDAMESLVNLAGGILALSMLSIAEQPADELHAFGHGKAEYFAAAFEGVLILIAATAIGVAGIDRLIHPQPLEQLGPGLAFTTLATIINFFAARVLLAAGQQYRSLTLEADAQHLMTDVWTSVGVIAGVFAAGASGWLWLDPLLALLVAANIVWTGWSLLRRSARGLMDGALSDGDHALVVSTLESFRNEGIDFHALRTRESGSRRFVEVHLLVPGHWTVVKGHALAERLESDIRRILPGSHVLTHLEPLDDPSSLEDIHLDR